MDVIESWWRAIGGFMGLVALARFGWRRVTSPGTPGLVGKLWNKSLDMADCERQNQSFRRQLAARDKLINSLQADLDRAVGIESSRGLQGTGPRRRPSATRVNRSRTTLPTTTKRGD